MPGAAKPVCEKQNEGEARELRRLKRYVQGIYVVPARCIANYMSDCEQATQHY